MRSTRRKLVLGLLLAAVGVASFGARTAAAATFTVITTDSGVQALRDTKPSDWWMSGLTFVDLDHDGDLDLFLSDHHDAGLAALNDGHGHFTAASGSYPTSEVHNCLDIDEDGKVDMDMTYADGGAKWWLNQTSVGSATLALADSGQINTREGNESREEALVDFNRDGKLDWVRSCQGQNFKVDFGDGAGKFTADSVLIPQPEGGALDAGILFADFDLDGDLDLLVNWGGYGVPDDYGRVRLLLNDGRMNLVEKTAELGLKPEHLAILGAGDVDQDGDVDLIGFEDKKFPEVIYLNDGHGRFSSLAGAVTGTPGSAEYSLWGLATVTDLDNDGVADILIDGRFFFHVLRGTGGGHFSYQNDDWGKITHLAEGSVDGGFAFGDLDADGDLDLMGFTAGDPERQVALYRNDLPAQHWLNVRPVGLAGNRSATNAQIRLYEAGTDHLLWFEEVLAFSKQAQQNYYAFDQLERHYGLGARESVDVTVTFYPSGTTVRKNGATADTTIAIGEDGTNGIVEPPKPTNPSGGASVGGVNAGGAPTILTAGNGEALPSGGASGATTSGSGAGQASAEPGSSDAGCGCRFAPSRGGSLASLVVVLALGCLRSRRAQASRTTTRRRKLR
ncbi:MAG: FG-GAP-like repeat-containing protein [Myxococcales bacterium]